MKSVVCCVSDHSAVNDDRVLRVEEYQMGLPCYSVFWMNRTELACPLLLDNGTVLSVGRKIVRREGPQLTSGTACSRSANRNLTS